MHVRIERPDQLSLWTADATGHSPLTERRARRRKYRSRLNATLAADGWVTTLRLLGIQADVKVEPYDA